MKAYLVGGVVRDRLLGYPYKERDWVVVGSSPTELTQQGYQQVGRDFPVFLHPKTKEEYALARIERKRAPGYHGFVCDSNPSVTLEEDLLRRDLTINAMAMDEDGRLIDPYNGEADLQARVLRHVSDAFVEDPVRVLRVARFAARYHHLGFTLAPETRVLMYAMVKRGELGYLVAERVWQEWSRSLEEKNPELFVEILRACGALRVVLPELDALFGVPNAGKFHPEIDSGIHSLQVLQAASGLSNDPMIRFAALVHDLGKAATPMALWPSHAGHDERGLDIIENLCQRLRIPTDYRRFARMVSRFHLKVHRCFKLSADAIVELLEQTDAFRRPNAFEKLLVVCEADAGGLKPGAAYNQGTHWRKLLQASLSINAQDLIAKGYEGEAIKLGLRKQRIICIERIINTWNPHEK